MTNILAGVPGAATSEKGVSVRIARAGESQYAAVLVPVLEGGHIVLFRRYRYPIAGWSLELPRSDWTNDARGWATSAKVNLLRETGLVARQIRLLGNIAADPALMSIVNVVLLAEGCRDPSPKTTMPELPAGSQAVQPERFDDLIRQGEITCGVTLAALNLHRAWQR
jgi:hypothetical protein